VPPEKLMYNRLMLVINKHDILTDARHGFRDKATETTGQFFFLNIQEPMNKHLYVLGLFFYL
jgi:hypothetical protein